MLRETGSWERARLTRKGNGGGRSPCLTNGAVAGQRCHTYSASTSPDSRAAAGSNPWRSPFRTRGGTNWRTRSS